jgi:hypothetical protein
MHGKEMILPDLLRNEFFTHSEIAVDGLKNAERRYTLHGMYGIEILREVEYQHREGEPCSPAYLN